MIDDEAKYVLRLEVIHYDDFGYQYRRISYVVTNILRYSHTRLKAIYYDSEGKLIQSENTFKVNPYYEDRQERFLMKYINDIEKTKSVKPFVMMHRSKESKWTYTAIKAKVLRSLDKYQTLEQLSQFVSRCCCSLDDQRPAITSIDDIVVESTIRVHADKCNDTEADAKVFDYIDVMVPLIVYGYSKSEIIEIVKKFKSDIDKKVFF